MLDAIHYVSFDCLLFDKSSPDDAIAAFGKPSTEKTNRRGAIVLEFPQFILRFDQTKRSLVECTILPYTAATIDGIQVTWNKQFLRELCQVDPKPRDAFGFIVFPSLGVAVTGIHDNDESQLALSLFSHAYLEEYLDGSTDFDPSVLEMVDE